LIDTNSMMPVYLSPAVLAIAFLMVFLFTLKRTWEWGGNEKKANPAFKDLALPEGSIKGLIAFLVVGGFLIFAFFGKPAFSTTTEEIVKANGQVIMNTDMPAKPLMTTKTDTSLFTTFLTAFVTLTGAVTGFYFGGRSSPSQSPG
jgi:ABC-type Fe3+ transport system permease subunit